MNENINNKLICSKCGTENNLNTNFCIQCGNQFNNVNTATTVVSATDIKQNINPINEQLDLNNNLGQSIDGFMQEPVYNNISSNVQVANTSAVSLNYLQYIIGTVLKPFDNFKKEEKKLNDFKNNGILALLIVGVMTIIGLFKTMLNVVRVKSFFGNEVKWVWENLTKINYFKVIGQSLLIYIGIIFAISGVYFLASLVMKKETKFTKLFGATVTAFIPFALATSIISPILSLISSQLEICVLVVGCIYSLVILLELMNEIVNIENKNIKIYFHLVCLSILIIGGGLIAYKIILSSLSSGLGGLSGLLK